jgi:hypothetical protein
MAKKKQSRLGRFIAGETSVERMARDLARQMKALSSDDIAEIDKQLDAAFPGGFSERDEANALIAMTVRNGPIEELHGGKHSPLLEDATLSRISDEEMKVLMIHATRLLAGLLHVREKEPELYRRWIRTYGMMYCGSWERDQ